LNYQSAVEIVGLEFARILRVEIGEIATTESLVARGIDSLLAQEARSNLYQATGMLLPLQRFFANASIDGIAHELVRLQEGDTCDFDKAGGGPGLWAEVSLSNEIRPVARREWSESPRQVFLTGATGFFGAYLLHELEVQTEAVIHCLVRAK